MSTAYANAGYEDLEAFLMRQLGITLKQARLIAKMFWRHKGRPFSDSARFIRDRFFGGRGTPRAMQQLIDRVVDKALFRRIGSTTSGNGLNGASVIEFTRELKATCNTWVEYVEGRKHERNGSSVGQTRAADRVGIGQSADDESRGMPVSVRHTKGGAVAGQRADTRRLGADLAQGNRLQPRVQGLDTRQFLDGGGASKLGDDPQKDPQLAQGAGGENLGGNCREQHSQEGAQQGAGGPHLSAKVLTPKKPAETLGNLLASAKVAFAQGVTKNQKEDFKRDKGGELGADAPRRQWQPGERIAWVKQQIEGKTQASNGQNRGYVHDPAAREAAIHAIRRDQWLNNLSQAACEIYRNDIRGLERAALTISRASKVSERKELSKSDRYELDTLDRQYRQLKNNGWSPVRLGRSTWKRIGQMWGKPAADRVL